MEDHISKACEILSTFKYCRKQTATFHKCLREKGSSACAAAEAAYVTCSRENSEAVISDLVHVSAKKVE